MLDTDNTVELDGSTKSHQLLLKKCLFWLSLNRPWVCWSNTSGHVKTEEGRYIKFGLKGSSDIIGFTDQGHFISIEIKTGKSVLSKQQKAFRTTCLKNNVKYFLVRPGIVFEKIFGDV